MSTVSSCWYHEMLITNLQVGAAFLTYILKAFFDMIVNSSGMLSILLLVAAII
jgi:hypothetical protein